jgi:hypothetical protein
MRQEGLGQLKEIDLIETRARDLPACSIVPQPTTLPRAPHWFDILCHTVMPNRNNLGFDKLYKLHPLVDKLIQISEERVKKREEDLNLSTVPRPCIQLE